MDSLLKAAMYVYRSYGLVIGSALPLPELTPVDSEPEVSIWKAEGLPARLPEDAEEGEHVRAASGEVFLRWHGIANMLVREGKDIIVRLLRSDVHARWLRQFILGPALGVLLHQRGLLVLHASAVVIEGKAAVIMGRKGMGKSTTAAGMHLRGHDLLADDVVAIDMTDPARPLVLPGIPQLKLWPDAAEALELHPDDLHLLHPRLEKCAQPVSAGHESRPLGSVYVLDHGNRHVVERLAPMRAFSRIARHVYSVRFVGEAGMTPQHFRNCAAFAQFGSTYCLQRERSLDRLSEVLDLLEDHSARRSCPEEKRRLFAESKKA